MKNKLRMLTAKLAMRIQMRKRRKSSYEIDMVNGPLFGKIVRFAIPLMLSGILQLFFNAADIVVVGRFAGSQALAAVGSTGSLINLLINLFVGVSIGTNVLVARYYGARDWDGIQETINTSIITAAVGGVALVFIGFFVSRPLLGLMGTPADVIEHSVLYMRIYFAGMPFFMLYNFGAAILRSVGDTKRPLYFLMIAGVINVILNLILVIVFHMGVAGVAIATVASQVVSCILVMRCLIHNEGAIHVDLGNLTFNKKRMTEMLRIGLPAGFQGMVFSISNVLIQSSVNSFGSIVMAGNTAAANIEGFVYTAMNAFYQTNLSFTSQNRQGAALLSRTCNSGWCSCGQRCLSARELFAWFLHHRPAGYCIWYEPSGNHLHNVFYLWSYGRNGGQYQRSWLCSYADDSFTYGCLRIQGCMDFYCVQNVPHTVQPLHFLSDILDNYLCGTSYLFSCSTQKGFCKNGKRNLKQKRSVLIS